MNPNSSISILEIKAFWGDISIGVHCILNKKQVSVSILTWFEKIYFSDPAGRM